MISSYSSYRNRGKTKKRDQELVNKVKEQDNPWTLSSAV